MMNKVAGIIISHIELHIEYGSLKSSHLGDHFDKFHATIPFLLTHFNLRPLEQHSKLLDIFFSDNSSSRNIWFKNDQRNAPTKV